MSTATLMKLWHGASPDRTLSSEAKKYYMTKVREGMSERKLGDLMELAGMESRKKDVKKVSKYAKNTKAGQTFYRKLYSQSRLNSALNCLIKIEFT